MFTSNQEKIAEGCVGEILLKTGDGGRLFLREYTPDRVPRPAHSQQRRGWALDSGQDMAAWVPQTGQVNESEKEKSHLKRSW